MCSSDLVAKIEIAPIVGAEVITGSTRLKAGTAQKLVLNMLSTASMIKLGKVYGNLMVDVKTSNKKLIERAKKIVCDATGINYKEAEKYLIETDYDVKLAIFMVISTLDKNTAKKKLEESKGYISTAIKNLK